ncbi:Uncharacterised protein [Streptococcus sp. NCTC 11567]|uniref:hypothetical protein n=1 Tax=Streptococcus sp. NCTC 11567 TaxID=2583584 RepID=UPI000617D88A|nr:hypothetical protein [Streptococcus sp. NCTC 11567]KKC20758.1 hypothetical protein WH14_00640 [Streptococcus dysgalactiae subsp. equisimilis]QBX15059.1 hypothetical protein Javan169_0054 [Streptococcus phage Javan169]VUD00425.1 Uncharacterised protein [Streptococcus sp. NCTC 11567]
METFSYPENAKELYKKHKKAIEQACEPIATMLALNNPELTDLANEALELYARTIYNACVDASIIIRNREHQHYRNQ